MQSDFFVTDVVSACYKRHSTGYVFHQKNRHHYGITLILSGEMELLIEGEQLPLTAGTIFLPKQNDKYRLKAIGEQDVEYIVISYCADPMDVLCSLLTERVLNTKKQKYKDLFENALRLSKSFSVCSGARLCASVQEILCCIIQESSHNSSLDEHSYAKQARLFMEQNFFLPLDSDLIAAEIGVSTSHLRATFKKEYSESLIHSLNEIRINHAKIMIESGNFTLREVAAECGFQNEYYFSRVFKQFTGITPGKY